MRFLLVEDNQRLQLLLGEAVKAAGYGLDTVSTVADFLACTASTVYDLIIVDLGLPDGDGLEAIRGLRAKGNSTPILVVTARANVDDRVLGLDAGADDYLPKPFNNAEFLARVRALLRRPGDVVGPIVEIGNTRINIGTLEVFCNETAVDLRFSERRLLMLLMRRAGALVPKNALESSLSEFGRDVTPNAIEALVSRTRRALADAGCDAQIETVRGIGYILKGRQR